MTLSETIQEIVNSFSEGDLFDSHTIINELITKSEYHIAYLREYPENCSVNQYHGQIAKMIGNLQNVKAFGKKVKTHTIYGDISENELWQIV
ncbi:hypothetical protein H0R92_08215 [Treponema sp. OMZ 840]|uniref:hypothetical protein n=1 Tax=Treponema sp. OMZ 840 TaxID=244313 RepID=UPI003D8B02B6